MNIRRSSLLLVLTSLLLSSLAAQERPDALKSYRQGRDLEAVGRAEEAKTAYEQAVSICKAEIEQNSTNMDSYTVLTWSQLRLKRYKDVIEWGQKALKINANDYRVIESMGEAWFYLNDYKESLKAMQRYVDAAPQGERVSVAYFFMGEIFRIQRRFMHADIAYSTAVRLEPNLPLWWFRLGQVRENAKDYSYAVTAYQQALRLNPAYREATEGLDRSKRQL